MGITSRMRTIMDQISCPAHGPGTNVQRHCRQVHLMNSSDFATAPSLSSQGSADPAASCTNTPHSPPVVQPRTSIPSSTGSPSGSHVGIHAARSPSSHHAQQIQALSSMLRAKTEAPRATQQQVKYSLIRHCCAEHVYTCTCTMVEWVDQSNKAWSIIRCSVNHSCD